MYVSTALLDLHERAHRNLKQLLTHCRELDEDELNRELDGFGYPTVRLQLHHAIGAEEYWIGVLRGLMLAEDNEDEFPTVAGLEAYREATFAATERYLEEASPDELNVARTMTTWGGREQTLIPACVFLRTQTHLYHHQGQILAMCRIMGKPGGGLDFPHE